MKKKYKCLNLDDYIFPGCREITGDELYRINGGGRIEPEQDENPPEGDSSNNSDSYTVQGGDTLSQIVYDYNQANGTNLTVDEVAQMSGIENPDLIYPGQSIVFGNNEQGDNSANSTSDVELTTTVSSNSTSSLKNGLLNEAGEIINDYHKDEPLPGQNLSQASMENLLIGENPFENKKNILTPAEQAEMARQDAILKQKSYKNNSWTFEYQKKYKEYVATKIEEYKNLKLKFTCEDLSLSLLIDFANENKLPLVIKNGSGSYDISKYKDIDKYKRKVLSTTAANDLMANTKQIDSTSVTKGDLILMDNGNYGKQKDGIMSHTQVVVGKDNGILEIRQGNFTEGMNSRYGSSNYGGCEIQNRKLDIINDIFYGSDNNIYKEATNGYGIEYRRWNYDAWNK